MSNIFTKKCQIFLHLLINEEGLGALPKFYLQTGSGMEPVYEFNQLIWQSFYAKFSKLNKVDLEE